MKKILTILLVLITIFSCNKVSDGEKVLKLHLAEEGATFDTSLATDASVLQITELLQDRLLKFNPETKKYEPSLAQSYEVSEDGLTWTFKIKEGLKYSDGSPLNANDFKYAWLRALNKDTASQYAYMLYPIKNAQKYNAGEIAESKVGIEVKDDYTLVVTLEAPTVYFDSLVSFITYAPLNKDIVEKFKDEYALEPDKMVYSGPFKMVNWEHNSSITLEKNENYHSPYKYDKVEVKFIKDSAATLNAYNNDEVDVIKLTTEQYEKYKDSKEVNLIEMATVWYLEYNCNNDVFKNEHIRRAFSMAVDKNNIVKNISNGINRVAQNLTPTNVGMIGLNDDFVKEINVKGLEYNVEEAKKELALGLKELNLTSLPEISLILNDSGNNKKIGEAIQENLRVNLGVDIKIEVMTFKERLQRMETNNFDIILAGWGADYQDPMTFLDLFVTNGGNNHAKFSNKEYDEMIEIAMKTTDKNTRFKALKRVEEIIADKAPITPLQQVRYIYLVKEHVKGLEFSAIGSDIIFSNVSIEK